MAKKRKAEKPQENNPPKKKRAKKEYVLSWSHYNAYKKKCPRNFLWTYGWKDIDVGGGPGKPKPMIHKRSEHYAVEGIVTQRVVERMYNDGLLKDPSTLLPKLEYYLDVDLKNNLEGRYIDWKKAGSQQIIRHDCWKEILGYLKTMKAHNLVGSYMKAEEGLYARLKGSWPIYGRVDLLIRRKDAGTLILDGKTTRKKERADPDQLQFYALCFYVASSGQLPDRLGFVFYRFPYGMVNEEGEIEQGVEWYRFSRHDLEKMAKKVLKVRMGMENKKFKPRPIPKVCRWCDYEDLCPERQVQREKNSKGLRKQVKIPDGAGFIDLGLL